MTNDAVEEILNSELLACVRSSFVVVYTMIFFNGCCFTAVVPSVPFYLQIFNAPPTFLGWVVSFYSVGQIIGSSIGRTVYTSPIECRMYRNVPCWMLPIL